MIKDIAKRILTIEENSDGVKTKKYCCLLLLSFALILIAIFGTVIFQMPAFVNSNINHLFDFVWILAFIPVALLDIRSFYKKSLELLLIVVPFLLYILVAIIFKRNPLGSYLTKSILLSLIIFLLFRLYSGFANKYQIRFFLITFLVASIILGVTIYFVALRGTSVSTAGYAYGSKNSTGPILLVASLILFFFLSKKHVWTEIIKYSLLIFFFVLICLMKCRTCIIAAIPVYGYTFYKSYEKKWPFYTYVLLIVIVLVLSLVVPQFNEIIFQNILLNNRNSGNIDDISSGRLSLIIYYLKTLEPFLGRAPVYVDCMPVSILCNYGVIGFLFVLPICSLPFIIYHLNKKNIVIVKNGFLYSLLITYTINALFEGTGYFGPGAKTFVFWIVLGLCSRGLSIYDLSFVKKTVSKTPFKFASKIADAKWTIFACFSLMFILMIPTTLVNKVATTFYNNLPSASQSIDYIEPEAIEISGPDKICLGQSITYDCTFTPEQVTDKSVTWSVWGSNDFVKDKNNGIIVPNRAATVTLCAMSNKNNKIFATKLISVVDKENYLFDDIVIETESGVKDTYNINETAVLKYDSNYLPKNCFKFVSTNDNVATVSEDGVIKFLSEGSADIFLETTTSFPQQSNIISFKVGSSVEIIPTNFTCDISDNLYINDLYSFIPAFKHNESKGFGVLLDNTDLQLNDGNIVFNSTGNHTIKVFSLINPNCFLEKTVNVKNNAIVDMRYYGDDWCLIGEERHIDIVLVHESGSERIAGPDDLMYEEGHARAGKNKNGYGRDILTIIPVKTGDYVCTFISKDNNFLLTKIVLHISPFTYQEYLDNAKSALQIACIVISTPLFCLLVFIKIGNHRYVYYFVLTFVVLGLFLRTAFIVRPTVLFWILISCSIIILGLLLFFKISNKDKKILECFNKNISLPVLKPQNNNSYYQISI